MPFSKYEGHKADRLIEHLGRCYEINIHDVARKCHELISLYLDEFSYDFPFNQLRDDETEYKGLFGIQRANFDTSLRNRTGEPYHVASMGALMSEFPPEIIALLTTGEYVKFGPEHGIQKALVDISTIGDLYNLSRVLEKYNSGDNINNCK